MISNVAGAPGLERARAAGIPAQLLRSPRAPARGPRPRDARPSCAPTASTSSAWPGTCGCSPRRSCAPSRPHPERAPVAAARLPRPGAARQALDARREGERGHRAPRRRGPRLGPHRAPGGGPGEGRRHRGDARRARSWRPSTAIYPRAVRMVLEGGCALEGRRVRGGRGMSDAVRRSSSRAAWTWSRAASLKEKLARGTPAHGEGRLRSHRARHPPRPHRADAEDEALPGPGPPGGVRDRRLHGDDRRPHRQVEDAAAAHPRGDRGQRGDVQAAGLQDPRPREDGDRASTASGWARSARTAWSGWPRPTTWRACWSAGTSGSATTPGSPSPCTSSSTRWPRPTTRWP